MADQGKKRPIRPRQAPTGRRKRRVVIDSQANRPRPDSRQARDRVDTRPKQPREVGQPTGPVTVQSGVTVKELSQALGKPVAEIIKIMMGLGEMVTITQSLSDEAVQLIAAEFKREVTIKHAAEEDEEPEAYDDPEDVLQPRPPVVTIMGHVDHGKTTLLDAIRETAVVETEAGGITQHIGAYQVEHDGRKLTFLDTPGHEAFTAMRARGAKVTDIAVLVVAADDGVMPQTSEAIDHARAARVPIVVALNKMDRDDINPDRVKQQLAEKDVVAEEYGGDVPVVPVSARTGDGIDDLLTTIAIVADIAELKANPHRTASGLVVEAKLDKSRGPVATVLVQRGTLNAGDVVVIGPVTGKIRALIDDKGRRIKSAGPSMPAEVLGLSGVPKAGDRLVVVPDEKSARQQAALYQRAAERNAGSAAGDVSLEDVFSRMKEGE